MLKTTTTATTTATTDGNTPHATAANRVSEDAPNSNNSDNVIMVVDEATTNEVVVIDTTKEKESAVVVDLTEDKTVSKKEKEATTTENATTMVESSDYLSRRTKRASPDTVANLVSEHDGSSLGSAHQKQQQHNTSELDEDNFRNVVTWSKQGGTHHQGEQIDPHTKVLFHFSYFEQASSRSSSNASGATEQLCVQTDATPDNLVGHRRCIFCYFNGGSDAGLLMHCVTNHSEQLDFNAARSEDGTLHIAVSKKAVPETSTPREFVYVRRPTTGARSVPSVPFVKRLPSEVARLDLQTRRKNMRLLSETGADDSAVKQFLPNSDVPIRQYYHSRSNEPMLEGAWDVDSDDEEDEEWLTKMSEELVDEFDDVTSSEKRFLKLWNRFMKCHTVVADQVIPSKCAEFVNEYSQMLVDMDLREELLLHFTGLWDAGLISATHLKNLMAEFDMLLVSACAMRPGKAAEEVNV